MCVGAIEGKVLGRVEREWENGERERENTFQHQLCLLAMSVSDSILLSIEHYRLNTQLCVSFRQFDFDLLGLVFPRRSYKTCKSKSILLVVLDTN